MSAKHISARGTDLPAPTSAEIRQWLRSDNTTALYDGRRQIGHLVNLPGSTAAFSADNRIIGRYRTRKEAKDAVWLTDASDREGGRA